MLRLLRLAGLRPVCTYTYIAAQLASPIVDSNDFKGKNFNLGAHPTWDLTEHRKVMVDDHCTKRRGEEHAHHTPPTQSKKGGEGRGKHHVTGERPRDRHPILNRDNPTHDTPNTRAGREGARITDKHRRATYETCDEQEAEPKAMEHVTHTTNSCAETLDMVVTWRRVAEQRMVRSEVQPRPQARTQR